MTIRMQAAPDGTLYRPKELRRLKLRKTAGRPQVETLPTGKGVYCKTKESICYAQFSADEMNYSLCQNCNRFTRERDCKEGFAFDRRADAARMKRWLKIKEGNVATRRFKL